MTDEEYLIRLGENVKSKRKEVFGYRGKNKLAKASGVAAPTINYIETGETSTSITNLRNVAKALGITVQSLLPEEEVEAC